MIRQYRNLIHPGRVKRLEKDVDSSGAIVAGQLVEIITRHISKQRQKTYGYTAEQFLERLRGGSFTHSLIPHLLIETPRQEIERLLISVIRDSYIEGFRDEHWSLDEVNALPLIYRTVFERAGEEVKRKVMQNVRTLFRNGPEKVVLLYEECFFHGGDLEYLPENDRQIVKDHFFARLSWENRHWLWWTTLRVLVPMSTRTRLVVFPKC